MAESAGRTDRGRRNGSALKAVMLMLAILGAVPVAYWVWARVAAENPSSLEVSTGFGSTACLHLVVTVDGFDHRYPTSAACASAEPGVAILYIPVQRGANIRVNVRLTVVDAQGAITEYGLATPIRLTANPGYTPTDVVLLRRQGDHLQGDATLLLRARFI